MESFKAFVICVLLYILSFCCCRCVSKDEEDYRPLFENFVQDLLSAVNKPEWPAAELLLSLLGRLLVRTHSYKQVYGIFGLVK